MFGGAMVAIVTPFKNGQVDEEAFRKLIEEQIAAGTDGIVPCGTTGESTTLSHEEHDRVIEITIDAVKKRVPVIAGTGSNSTAEALRLTRHAWEAGEPAIVESHRVNFAHTDPTRVETGLAALDQYLGLVAGNLSAAPVFLTDHEIAQLNRSGTSWRVKGGSVIVRNATRSARILPVPAEALARAAAARGDTRAFPNSVLVALPAGVTVDLVP